MSNSGADSILDVYVKMACVTTENKRVDYKLCNLGEQLCDYRQVKVIR